MFVNIYPNTLTGKREFSLVSYQINNTYTFLNQIYGF